MTSGEKVLCNGIIHAASAAARGAGWIPVIGNAVNAATAASLTEVMGWLMVNEFEKQRA